jgi:YD repeat-containing protein
MKTAIRKTLTGVILLLTMGIASTLRAQSNSPVQYFYDDLGRLVRVVDQNGNMATYQYDAVGNLLAITRSALPGSGGLAILGFTPQQGPVGATVTIQGQGFSATPSADSVELNGTPATVTAPLPNIPGTGGAPEYYFPTGTPPGCVGPPAPLH